MVSTIERFHCTPNTRACLFTLVNVDLWSRLTSNVRKTGREKAANSKKTMMKTDTKLLARL